MIALLAVEEEAKRIEMQEVAAVQGWSLADLRVTVRKLYGRPRRSGGRERLLPKTPAAALRLLKTYSEYAVVLCRRLEDSWLKGEKLRVPMSLQDDLARTMLALVQAEKMAGEWKRRYLRVVGAAAVNSDGRTKRSTTR